MRFFNFLKEQGADPGQLTEEELKELEDQQIGERLRESKKHVRVKQFLRHPREMMYLYPEYGMVFSFPLAVIFLFFGLMKTRGTIFTDDVIIFTVLIFISLPSLTYFARRKRIDQVEQSLPNFLRDLAEMSRAGLTLPSAVNTITRGEYGALTGEIRKMDASLSWGVSFETTLENFAKRMNTPLISRTVALITQASRSGGKVSLVLEAAARDAAEIKNLQGERRANMMPYVVVVYMAFFVFIFVVLILSAKFVPVMAEAGAQAQAVGAGTQFIGAFDPDSFKRLFFHASVIQGFVAGLVSGQMGEGSAVEGLKHSLVMTMIAWVAFTFLI
jgi:flagellar protein FlaJ